MALIPPAVQAAVVAPAPVRAPRPFAILRPDGVGRADAAALARVIVQADAAATRPARARAELHTEGTLPGKGIREESLYAKEDQGAVLALAAAWRATGLARYRDAADRYLLAWSTTYRPSFNPIDETGFDQLLMADDLVHADLSSATQAAVTALWRRMAAGYLDAMDGHPRGEEGNWQSHRVKLAAMAAFATGDASLIARAGRAYNRQIADNVNADGLVRDFAERDALHYVTYDLDPLLMAALAARAHGQDWFGHPNPSGASLATALTWLKPFALGASNHVEFVHSQVWFDRERAAAGQGEYAPHAWDRGNAVATFALAGPFDPHYDETARLIAAATGRHPPYWTRLVAGSATPRSPALAAPPAR